MNLGVDGKNERVEMINLLLDTLISLNLVYKKTPQKIEAFLVL